MKTTAFFASERELGRTVTAQQLMLVHITNLQDLMAVYGTSFYRDAATFIETRLESLGGQKPAVALNGSYIFIDLQACPNITFYSQDTWCEHVHALLAYEPVICAKEKVFLGIETTFIDRNDQEFLLANDCDPSGTKNKIKAAATPKKRNQKEKSYKADMALALCLFSQLAANTLVLAFQPIKSTKSKGSSIYWESLLRRRTDPSSSGFATCAIYIAALERLGLIGRLDRSILWTILDLLIKHPGIRLGCNISALSLKFDCWWRLIFEALQTQPEVASRLTVEITETSSITQDDEAITLLQVLKVLGCKIAIDDMGSGYSTLDFVVRSRPDFVKIDRTYLHLANTVRFPSSPGILRNLTQLCADLSPCVITEGIESERDRSDAVAAGADGLQGYLFGRPDVLPNWLNAPIAVRDAFDSGHPSHFMPLPASISTANTTVFANPQPGL